MKLKNKVAIVTGGARGIGAAIVDRYVAEGAKVAVADIAFAQAKETAAKHGDKAFAVAIDVTKIASIEAAVEAVVKRWGGIDILVNNAGVFDMGPIVEVTRGELGQAVRGQHQGPVLHAAGGRQADDQAGAGRQDRQLRLAGGPARRSAGRDLLRLQGGGAQLTQSAGLDLIKHQINVNGIAPGVADTPMWDHVDALFAKYEHRPIGEKKRLVGEAVPFGRMGLPEDHVGAAVFLASSDADYVVAQTLNVDGGNWMS